MNDQVIIRKAVDNDLLELLEFEQSIIKAEQPFDITIKSWHTNYYKLKEMICADDVEIVVAELNKKLVASGYARVENSDSFLKHKQHAFLGFMYVVPELRGKGINKKIVEQLIVWVASKNIHELRLEVYEKNLSAIKAYEKIGFTKHMMEMRLAL